MMIQSQHIGAMHMGKTPYKQLHWLFRDLHYVPHFWSTSDILSPCVTVVNQLSGTL